jgi:hypothetical protein
MSCLHDCDADGAWVHVKACDLARGLVEQSNGTLALAPSTSTVTLIDEYEPLKPVPFSHIALLWIVSLCTR